MISKVLENLFKILNEKEISYVLLWNYNDMENLGMEGDIDLLVNKNDQKSFKKILRSEKWIYRSSFIKKRGCFEMFKADSEKDCIYVLDVQTEISKVEFFKNEIKAEKILQGKRKVNGLVYTPSIVHGFLIYAFRLIFEKKIVSSKNLDQLNILYSSCLKEGDLSRKIDDEFNKPVYELFSLFFKNKENNFTLKDVEFFKKISRKYNLKKKSYFLNFRNKFFYKINAIFSLFRPVKLVVFLGPDGSGKTTHINKIRSTLPLFGPSLYLGWDQYFFRVTKFFDKGKKGGGIRLLLDKIYTVSFHLFLPFDYFARFLKAKINSKYGYILVDRFPLPRFEDAEKKVFSFLNVVENFGLFLSYILLPSPGIVFILSGDPKKIWQRKKESSYEKFLDLYNRSKKAEKIFNAKIIKIDTEQKVEESYKEIHHNLVKFIAKI